MNEISREREGERDQIRPQRHMQAGVENRRHQYSGVSVHRVFAAHLDAYSSEEVYFTSLLSYSNIMTVILT